MSASTTLVFLVLGRDWLARLLDANPLVLAAAAVPLVAHLLHVAFEGQSARHLLGARRRSLAAHCDLPARPIAYAGLRHLGSYPPVWVAGVLGAALVLAALVVEGPGLLELPSHHRDGHSVGAAMLAVLPLVVGLSLLAASGFRGLQFSFQRWRKSRAADEGQVVPAADSGLFDSWDRLQPWIESDDAVTSTSDDAFGHLAIAKRVARRLDQRPMPSQAVIGALGTGKTTLRYLVQAELGPDSRVHVLPVQLWPYETPEAAVAGVLRTLLHGVGREVNVLAARGLPAQYLAAMGAAGTFGSALANIDGIARSPLNVLAKLDPIAATIDHRFVIWVEDLERFAGSTQGESPEHAMRLAPLRALLSGLSELTSIGVVTATTQLQARFDLEKIAQYVEELPLLDRRQALRALRTFRAGCLGRVFIDPAPPESRAEWNRAEPADITQLRELFPDRIRSAPEAAASLCRTPRAFKQALRHVLASWQVLGGEIDFDDLLLMHLLRQAEPDVFAVVREHWAGLAASATSEMMKEARKDARLAIDAAIKAAGPNSAAVNQVIEAVFGRGIPKPQGLARARYWARYMAVPELSEADRDQPVLQTLLASDDDAVLDLLEGDRSEQVANFAGLLSTERLLGLLEPLCRRRRTESPREWPTELWGGERPPGLIPLWAILENRKPPQVPKGREVFEGVVGALEVAIENLQLVHDLEYFLISPKPDDGLLYRNGIEEGQGLAADARARMWDLLVAKYSGHPEALIRALRGARFWILRHVVWGSLRAESNALEGEPFSEWKQLAPTILEACKLDRTVMLPQLAAMIAREAGTRHDETGAHTVFEYDADQAENLFGDQGSVLRLFVEPFDGDPHARGAIEAVRLAAASLPADPES